jgi:hypothetical protein
MARRRSTLGGVAAPVAVAALLAAAGCGSSHASTGTVAPASTSAAPVSSDSASTSTTVAALRVLPAGKYLGNPRRVDVARQTMVIDLVPGCGVPSGWWQVNLAGAQFDVTSNPIDPAAGHLTTVPFSAWASHYWTQAPTWSVVIGSGPTVVSDGPTAFTCKG